MKIIFLYLLIVRYLLDISFTMKNFEEINKSVVLLDRNSSIIDTQQPIKVENPFLDLANKIVLSSIYNTSFEERQNANKIINRNFTSEKYDVSYNLFPCRFQITQKGKDEQFLQKTLKLIKDANIDSKIGKIGFNFLLFTIDLDDIKKKILKQDFLKSYSGFAITFSQEIDDYCKLTIRLSEANKTTLQDNKEQLGMLIDANFEQVLTKENTADNVFKVDYNKLVEDYVKNIL